MRLALLLRGLTAAECARQSGCARRRPKPRVAGKPFDHGAFENLVKAFGRNPLLWLVPTTHNIDGNGIFFDVRRAPSLAMSSPCAHP